MSELKPCPFCGGEAAIIRKGNDRTAKRSVTVKCKGCRFQRTDGAIRYGMDWLEEVATRAWNTRPAAVPVEELREIETTLTYARLFLRSREKASPEGIALHDKCLDLVRQFIDQAERREGGDG